MLESPLSVSILNSHDRTLLILPENYNARILYLNAQTAFFQFSVNVDYEASYMHVGWVNIDI